MKKFDTLEFTYGNNSEIYKIEKLTIRKNYQKRTKLIYINETQSVSAYFLENKIMIINKVNPGVISIYHEYVYFSYKFCFG